jgi:predicted phosphoribosyltransferase
MRREVDEVVCLLQPRKMYAIGMWYEDFSQVSDVEVMRLLELARTRSVVAHEVTERGPM